MDPDTSHRVIKVGTCANMATSRALSLAARCPISSIDPDLADASIFATFH